MFEKTTHSFVIKIWLEQTQEELNHVVWRGRVVHVDTGERVFIKDYDEILSFISPYIEQLGEEDHTG